MKKRGEKRNKSYFRRASKLTFTTKTFPGNETQLPNRGRKMKSVTTGGRVPAESRRKKWETTRISWDDQNISLADFVNWAKILDVHR